MKIVQSFWTKPFMQSKNSEGNRFNGGWPSRKLNYYSMVLSCLQLKKFYPDIEIVTDELGKEILIDKLDLPYSAVYTDLENLGNQHPGLWALGKIHAYAKQVKPFLHIDLDIFISQSFREDINCADLVAQNVEVGTGDYVETVNYIMSEFDYIPKYMEVFRDQRYMPGVNAGVFGGVNVDLFKEYTDEVFKFLDKNEESIDQFFETDLSNEFLNVFYEQMIFYGLTRSKQMGITYLFPKHNNTPKNIGYMHLAQTHNGYVHAYAGFKRKRVVYRLIEKELKKNHPEYFERVNALTSKFEL